RGRRPVIPRLREPAADPRDAVRGVSGAPRRWGVGTRGLSVLRGAARLRRRRGRWPAAPRLPLLRRRVDLRAPRLPVLRQCPDQGPGAARGGGEGRGVFGVG